MSGVNSGDPSQEVLGLDASTQRRLILQAAKECGDLASKAVEREQPTLSELNSSILTYSALSIFLSFTFILPFVFIPLIVWPMYRTKRTLFDRWRSYIEAPDPECSHRILVGVVKRAMAALPRGSRKLKKEVGQELKSIVKTLDDLRKRRDGVAAALRQSAPAGLEALEDRLDRETDPVLRRTLQSQIDATQTQESNQKNLAVWNLRLAAAEDSCVASLQELLSHISLVTATGGALTASTFDETTASLQRINAELHSAQSAAEEVLLFGSESRG